jgi:hypothetical protein
MILVVVILETVYPIFEFVAFEDEVETVLPQTVGGGVGVAFDMNVVAENNFDKAENIRGPAAAASYYSS